MAKILETTTGAFRPERAIVMIKHLQQMCLPHQNGATRYVDARVSQLRGRGCRSTSTKSRWSITTTVPAATCRQGDRQIASRPSTGARDADPEIFGWSFQICDALRGP